MINLKIDPEFQSQIPPLTDDEFKQLEENILKEGKLLSPLIVWNNTLVDGHNRYAILQKHPEIYFSTMPLQFENREETIAWICRNQLGRRNLSPEQKRYLLGKQYEAEKKAAKIFRGNQYTLAKKSGGDHGDNHHSGKKTCDRIAEENGVSRASVLRASHYTRGIDIADNLSPGIKQKVFSGEVKFTNEEMSKLVQVSAEHRSDVLAQILHPEALEVLESASAEFEPEKAEPVPMPTPQTEEFRCYHVPDEFMKVYKSLSRATEMMKNSWNHHFIKSSRQFFQLRSQNGVIPNAFQEGVTEDGQRIRVDENFVPSVVPSIIQDGNKITIHANSVEEARTMASKKLKRLHATPEQIQNYISKIDESLFQELQPEIRYDITLDINRFLLEALKIGYEYALLKFGDAYWDDPTALKIRNRLNCAISGKMQDTCERPPEASYVPDYLMQGLSRTPLIGAHWISITSTLHNQLVAHIILFFNPVSSFQVLLSEQADCYLENGQILEDFVELPHKGGIDYDKLQEYTGRQSCPK